MPIGTYTYYPDVAVSPSGGDDGPSILSAWQTARGRGGGLILDASTASLLLTGTSLILSPIGGASADIGSKIICLNKSNGTPTINYTGSSAHAIKMYGLKYGTIDNLNIRSTIDSKTLLWIATRNPEQSTNQLWFRNCLFGLYGNSCSGVAIGADDDSPTPGIRDINSIRFSDCAVSVQTGKTCKYGWTVFSGNNLNNIWENCYVTGYNNDIIGWRFETDTDYVITGAGGDASSLINCGGSFLKQVVRMGTGFGINVVGGRSELCGSTGLGVFEVGAGSNANAGLVVQGHTTTGVVSGAYGFRSQGNTPVVVRDSRANGTLYNQVVTNETLLAVP